MGLAHVIFGAETSHALLSASQRPGTTGGAFPVQAQRPESQGSPAVSPSVSLKAGKPGAAASEDRRRQVAQIKLSLERAKVPSSSSCSTQPWSWMLPAHTDLMSVSCSLLISRPFPETFSQTHPEIVFH